MDLASSAIIAEDARSSKAVLNLKPSSPCALARLEETIHLHELLRYSLVAVVILYGIFLFWIIHWPDVACFGGNKGTNKRHYLFTKLCILYLKDYIL